MQDEIFEKLGQFYLGKQYDMDRRERTEQHLLYDSRDLCTHAVVVGMTGSGKTGLCIDLLEEAAMDNIPAIVIDPKGDISNLLLTFPELSAEEFLPWIDEGQADRKGLSNEEFATAEADKWKKGLAGWGQDGDRIKRMREKVEMRIYTPGSNSGRPLNILKSFAAPAPEIVNQTDSLNERISSAVSGLLGLIGIDADPINSSEHILISKILDHHWKQQQDLDLASLIQQILDPPFERFGILELEDFFSKKDRQALAMTLNNLLASPSFSSWMQGEPIDIKSMLHTDSGKPCISIISIAHLSENERMFFVTLVLNEMITWMRSQAGTSSLRAILYMDEVFGYFPPSKNPPSKQPMLTLLKQARAYGLGCVLATQNPVDLDYKGLSNAGTWFLGRLQTERDKMRVLEGLEGASTHAGSSFDRGQMEKTLAGLGSRVFLMNNVHEDHPVIFETRWAMSYLRGPLTRKQLQKLTQQHNPVSPEDSQVKTASPATPPSPKPPKPTAQQSPPPAAAQIQAMIPSSIPQLIVQPSSTVKPSDHVVYEPGLLATGRLHYVRASYKIDQWLDRSLLTFIQAGEMPNEVWEKSQLVSAPLNTNPESVDELTLSTPAPDLQASKNYTQWKKSLVDFLYQKHELKLWKCEELKQYSHAEETLGEFKVRIEQMASEHRDGEVDKLRQKHEKRFATLEGKIKRAEEKVEIQTEQYEQSRTSLMTTLGTTLVGVLMGRRSTRNASSSVRSYSRSSKEKSDIRRAEDKLKELESEIKTLNQEFEEDVNRLSSKLATENLEYTEHQLPPRKSDISIVNYAIHWLPFRVNPEGELEQLY
ncbi:MAG: DUF87 domain-containing protein [Planctomycetaceae bacterium]|nr:DUF87 domain-containing protein [Planctomycetaceae bacterium]